jgi:hypothetical protein
LIRGRPGDLHGLAAGLGLPLDLPRARDAAATLLGSPDPGPLVDRLHPLLVWHRGWGHALGHLARAGADLEALSLSAEVFRSSFPVRRRRLWSLEERFLGGRLPLASLADLLARHKRLLRAATEEILRDAELEIVPLSGRALEALYPGYHERIELDAASAGAG